MDKKDEIILQQLEVIRSMTEHNLRHVGDDIWGVPKPPAPEKPPGAEKPPGGGEKPADNTENKNAGSVTQVPASPVTPAAEAEEPPEETMEELKAELEGYIGLKSIKREVENLINMVTVHKLREEHGLPTTDMSLHMVFTGSPGTGKTMIARLMARIYRCLGILSKGQLVETDRSGLVAGYVGQTAIKTSEVIKKAEGGVLFIDEAYTLSSSKGENDFGQESIDTLLKAMEDKREDLVVIVAGYDELMQGFIHSNPGLESRFNRFLKFEDYTVDEMMEIFRMQCKKGFYELDDDAREAVREFIIDENTDAQSFGNARGVRNLFERILVAQANRLAKTENVTRDDLMRVTERDVWAAADRLEEPDAEPEAEEGEERPGETDSDGE